MLRRVTFLAMLFALSGCAAPRGPEVLTLSAAHYDLAFDAAVEAARQMDLRAGLLDRRGGIIHTEPTIAGSLLEPWDRANLSFEQALENTIAFQRRSARFEFAPAGDGETPEAESDTPPAPRPPSPGEKEPDAPDHASAMLLPPPPDLTQYDGEIELRVIVPIERAHTPGLRRSTWTRRATTRAVEIETETGDPFPARHWLKIGRDHLLEERLLADVQREMERHGLAINARRPRASAQ